MKNIPSHIHSRRVPYTFNAFTVLDMALKLKQWPGSNLVTISLFRDQPRTTGLEAIHGRFSRSKDPELLMGCGSHGSIRPAAYDGVPGR